MNLKILSSHMVNIPKVRDIKVIESSGNNEWDSELKKINASVFLTYAWLDAINSKESKPVYLKFLADHEVVGFIAGLIRPVRKSSRKQLFFYSGPACADKEPTLFDEFRKALLDYAKANGFHRLTIQSNDVSFYSKTSLKKFITRERSEFYFDLTIDFQEFESQIERDTRRRIRKAKKNNLVFGSGYSDELLDSLLLLMKSTFDIRLSKDYLSYNMFSMQFLDRQVMRKLLDNRTAALYYVKSGNEIVSMQFVLTINQRAYGIYMGTNTLGYKLSAPSLLFYQIVYNCKQNGAYIYNIGGVPTGNKNKGIREFKKNLGAKTVQSCVETTDFLLFPLKILNTLLIIRRIILGFYIPWIIKKQLKKIFNLFFKDIDHV